MNKNKALKIMKAYNMLNAGTSPTYILVCFGNYNENKTECITKVTMRSRYFIECLICRNLKKKGDLKCLEKRK